MSTSTKINKLDIAVEENIGSTSTETNVAGAGNGEMRVKPVPVEKPNQADDNSDSFSNALLNESFDSMSDIQPSFSSSKDDDSETFSLSDPVYSPTLHKLGDFDFLDIAIPKLKPSDEDSFSHGAVTPVKTQYKPNRSIDSPPVYQATKSKHATIQLDKKHPSDVTAVSYVFPDTPAHWAQSESYFAATAMSNPYSVICSANQQLAALKYILPCLEGVHNSSINNVDRYHGHGSQCQGTNSYPHDITIGTRRVEAAVCAFGGLLPSDHQRHKRSIFRHKTGPSSKTRQHYEQTLPSRYLISDRRISWDIEEHPPIPNMGGVKVPDDDASANEDEDQKSPSEPTSKRARFDTSSSSVGDNSSSSNSKYRCKLCGQPKHNHSCPYRPSLHRSIGVMVYPAANAYTAAEPGRIAPPLTEMNNDVLYDSDNSHPCDTSADMLVTPEIPRVATTRRSFHSPESALTGEDSPHNRSHSRMNNMPLVSSVALHPEQFRAITPADGAYSYPPIPLTFMERKRLSDSLFLLARQIPHMMEEIAAVLHQVRMQDEWDQGTAELLTQVVIGLFCFEGDARLDGLQRYLLSMGISC